MLDRKPEEYVADYGDYCKDMNINPNEENSITQYLNEYARWHVMFKGIGDLQPKLMELEGILKEKERYPLEESKKLVESHLDDYSAEKEYEVTYIDGEGKDKEIKFTPSKNTNIAGIQKELGKKQKDFFKLKDIKECKLTESKKIEEDNEVEGGKLTISEKLLLEIIQSVNSEYTLDNVMCQSTPQGNIHITTRDGKDICTVGREEFTISGDDTILIDELRDNGYWYENLEELDEEVLIEKEDTSVSDDEIREIIVKTTREYVEEFKRNVRGIIARYSTGYSNNSFYIDYSAIRPTYTKQDAKKALEIFTKYCDILTLYCDILKFRHPEIEYTVGKTYVSSARIGRSLNVYELPFDLEKGYMMTEELNMEKKTEGTDLSVNDNTVIVNKNQYGYNTIAIIIDDANKRFQLVTGQSLPTGKYKKASKKAIRDKAEDLKAKGYEEVKGKFSLAERKTENKKITESMSKEDIMACYISDITNYAYTYTQEEAQKEIDFVLNDLRNDKDLDDKDKAMVMRFVKSTLLDRNIRFEEIKSSSEDIIDGKAFSVKDEEILAYIQDRLVDELGRDWRSKSLIDIEDITYNAVDQYADEHGEDDLNPSPYYKEIKKLCEGRVTTAKGEFEHEELKAMETEMKDAFKDYWAGKISGADLEAVKSKLGKYLTQGQISNCQYDASREVEKVTEGKEETPEEILDRAIEEEQDAIDTYDELLDGIEDEDLEEVIKEIQKDEEDHKEILNHYDETGEVITDEDLEEKDELLEEELIEDDEYEDMETVIEYTITYMDMTDDEIFDNQEEADARFAELKADGQLGNVRQYFAKAWDFEHGGYVEGDVEVYYNNGDELEESLTEGAENGMTFGEFKTRLNDLYHNVLPNSACTVQLGALGGDSMYITYYLAANASECPNGIAGNDLYHIGFCVREDKSGYSDGARLTDDTVLPENLVLEVNSNTILTTPENKYMAYGSERLPFRKAKGNAEKILQTLEKYASKTKEVTIRLLDEGRIPEDRIELVSSKVK